MNKKIILLIVVISFFVTGCWNNEEKSVVNKNDKIVKIDKHILGNKFIRTYHIYHIADSKRESFVYVTIRGYNQEDIDTVLVERALFPSLELNKDYEFTFKIIDEDIDESIQSIFNNSEIVDIRETDKIGEEQINEEMKGNS